MSDRLRKALSAFVKVAGPISDLAGDVLAFDRAAAELAEALELDPLEPSVVDALCAAVDQDVRSGILDARSRTADARLDVGASFSPGEVAEVAANPRSQVERRRADARFLRDSGLLGEVNRRVLHPLGAALAVEVDPRDGDPLRISPRLVRTDDPVGIVFEDGPDEHLRRHRAFMRGDGFERLAARRAALGFRVQPPEGVDPDLPDDLDPEEVVLAAGARAVVEAAREVLEDLDGIDGEFDLADLGPLRGALAALDAREFPPVRPIAVVRVAGGCLPDEDVRRLESWLERLRRGAAESTFFVGLSEGVDLSVELLGPGAKETAERAEVRVVLLDVDDRRWGSAGPEVVEAARALLEEFTTQTGPNSPDDVDPTLAARAVELGGALRRFDAGEVEAAVTTGWGENPAAVDVTRGSGVEPDLDRRARGVLDPRPEVLRRATEAVDRALQNADPEFRRAALETLDLTRGPEIDRPRRVVHALEAGRALCGAGEPTSWPDGETWLPADAFRVGGPFSTACPGCAEALRSRPRRGQLGQ